MDKEKYVKYINHLKKVIPRVIEEGGAATGYWFRDCKTFTHNNICMMALHIVGIVCKFYNFNYYSYSTAHR